MKKLLVAVALLVVSSFAFANERIFEDFINKGTFVKVISNSEILYWQKNALSTIIINGDRVKIGGEFFNIKDISSDKYSNLIIKK